MPWTDAQIMQIAIDEAYRGATRVSPNPLVGAVVVNPDGQIIGQGHHEYYGGPHAEVNALRDLTTEQLRGATVFVTLEPCAHEGKTPSCAKMMAKLPLKKVVYGLVDPNPLVSGQGAQILESAGIQTELFTESHPEFLEPLEEVCEIFLWNYRKKKVFVSLKVAQSLDGQIGLKNGESKWITNEKSREHAHYLRAIHDATLIGRGTLQMDNPSLDIRHPSLQKKNRVVVLDPSGQGLQQISQYRLSSLHQPQDLFWCVSETIAKNLDSKAATIVPVQENEGTLDLDDLLSKLWQQGLRSVMIEGGAVTASRFLNQNLVQRLYVFQAPVIIGAGGGRSWSEQLSIPSMAERRALRLVRTRSFGQDMLITGLFGDPPGPKSIR